MYAALIALFSLLIHYIWSCFGEESFFGSFFSVKTIHEIVKYFIVAVSIIIVSVPEGLPLSVSTALISSIKELQKHNLTIRLFSACERMGFVDNFIVDKTGTLTKNLLTVTSIFVEEQIKETIDKSVMSESTGRLFGLGVCNNSQADPKFSGEGSELKMEANGNRSECALLEAAYKLGFDYRKIRNNDRIKKVFPFSS
jgi:magnesium-transporting ATPase (P-type)